MLMRSLSARQGYVKCEDQPDLLYGEINENSGNLAQSVEVDRVSQKCDQITQPERGHAVGKGLYSNIFLLVPFIFSGSLLLGTLFYKMHHGWQLSTAFYFSAQVLAGCMYDTPSESDPVSTSFTLMFFLFGSSAMAAAFGAFVSTLVSDSSRIASDARKNIRSGPFEQTPAAASQKSSRYEVLTALVWYSFGITYGVLYEGWPLSTACRFSLGAMAASGVPPPQCYKVDGYDDCQLGNVRGIFVGIYVMVGVPLFAFTLGQFAGMIVERAIREREMQIMSRPLGESEFKFALTLKRNLKTATATVTAVPSNEKGVDGRRNTVSHTTMSEKVRSTFKDHSPLLQRKDPQHHQCGGEFSNSSSLGQGLGPHPHRNRQRAYSDSCIKAAKADQQSSASEQQPPESSFSEFAIDFGEFVVLEMLRLRRVDEHDLEAIRNLFDDIDYDNAGTIDQAKLERFSHLLHTSARADAQEITRDEVPHGTRVNGTSSFVKCESDMSMSGHDCVTAPPIAAHSAIGLPQYYTEIPEIVEYPGSKGSMLPVMSSNTVVQDRLSMRSNTSNSTQYSLPVEQYSDVVDSLTSSAPPENLRSLGSPSASLQGSFQKEFFKNIDGDKVEENSQSLSAMGRSGGDSDGVFDIGRPRGGSITSKESATVHKHSIADEYNRLLMPILHLRHQASASSARLGRGERRPSIGSTATEASPGSVRRQSIDVDAYSDSESEDSPTRRGARTGFWPILGEKGMGMGMEGLDSNGKRVRDRRRNGFPGHFLEEGSDQEEAMESGLGLGSGSGSGRGPREEVDTEEEGTISILLKSFGFSKYGAMNAIEEENAT